MSDIKTFRDLEAWRVGMQVVESTYLLSADFPNTERFGLVSQMRRAAVSIPSNIAEGQAVKSTRWSLRHIATAIGSAAELDTQLEIALRLRFVTTEAARELRDRLQRVRILLYGLRRRKQAQLATSVGGTSVILVLAFLRIISG